MSDRSAGREVLTSEEPDTPSRTFVPRDLVASKEEKEMMKKLGIAAGSTGEN